MFKRVIRLKKRQVTVLWLLVLVLVLPMILFFHAGFGGAARPGPGGAAGRLFGKSVPWEEFQQEYGVTRRTFERQFGGGLPEGMEPFLRQQTWERLMLRQEAGRQVQIPNEELARHLQGQPAFQQDGRFVPELYFHFVRALGLSPQQFEERVRDDLRIQRLMEGVRSEVTVTDEELRHAWAESHDPVDEVEFRLDREAFRTAVLTHKAQASLAAWFNELRQRAKLKSFLEEPSPPR